MSQGQLQNLIERIENITSSSHDLKTILAELEQWRLLFEKQLLFHQISLKRLKPESILAQHIRHLNIQIITQIQTWDIKWSALQAVQSLADVFADKVMLLVFGKFNAGKSSLCNFLADCFRAQGQNVRYFYVQNDQVYYSETLLREGATETTSGLQGVCLGENLVLLDTPGLHSVTLENAELTQKIMDSADGVLWLTSSTSPGQVQELYSLARELKRNKPLFPIITRSDQVEEDEVDGEIYTVLCNKSTQQRMLQEQDVFIRAQEKLIEMQIDVFFLKNPVSVSTQMARQEHLQTHSMEDSGFERLFEALLKVIQPALHYKQRKPAEIYLHYLQEQIVEMLSITLQPLLLQIQETIQSAKLVLSQQQQNIAENVWRSVIPELPKIIEQYFSVEEHHLIYQCILNHLQNTFLDQIQQKLCDYIIEIDNKIEFSISPSNQIKQNLQFEKIYKILSEQVSQAIQSYTAKVMIQYEAQLQSTQNEYEQLQMLLSKYSQLLDEIAIQLRH